MKFKVLKPFGSRSGTKIYQPGEVVSFPKGSVRVTRFLNGNFIAPLKLSNKLPDDIRNLLQTWVDCQENPIKEIGILHHRYYKTHNVDEDGFYCYTFYGYVNPYCNNRVAVRIEMRLKKPLSFDFDESHDYTLSELGLKEKK